MKRPHLNGFALLVAALTLGGCAVAPPSEAERPPANEPRAHTVTDEAGNVSRGSLLNGQWHGPVEIVHPNGNVTAGTMEHGQWVGEASFRATNGAACSGRMTREGRDGLWKCHNPLNDLTTFLVYQGGKEIKTFTELEPLWAAGRYDEVFRLRGRKSLIGINLKDAQKATEVVVQNVQLHSPGFLAGLRPDDVITAMDGQPVAKMEDLIRRIVAWPFGKSVRLDIRRGGRAMTLDLTPGTVPRNFVDADGRPVASSESRLWDHYRSLDTSEGYSRYLESVVESPYRDEATRRLAAARAQEGARLKAWRQAGNIGEIAAYLLDHPASPLRTEAIGAATELLGTGSARGKAYTEFIRRCPPCSTLLPAQYAIMGVGPTGLTVGDAVRLQAQGIGPDILAAKIEGAGGEYRDFSFDEIQFLGTMGLTSPVVTAMIRSTHARASKKLQDENQKLQQENLALKQQAAQKLAAPAATSTPAQSAAPSVVEECVKLAAALAACDQAGGLLKTGCRIMAQSSFQCPLPGYR